MKRSHRWLAATALVLALAACQTAAPPGTDDGADTTAPEIVSVTPADGANGVTRSAKIKIQFSEPMDIVSTQAAYASDSDGIKPAQVTFTWEDQGKRLVITPNAPLAYSPDENYKTYTFTLSTAATDKAGNPLVEAKTVSFNTLRTLTGQLQAERIDGAAYYASDASGQSYGASSTGDTAFAGLSDTDAGDYYCDRAFFSFALSGLPAGTEEVLAARLGLTASQVGDPSSFTYYLDHVNFGDTLDGDDYDLSVYATGEWTFASFNDGSETAFDVGDWVQTSFAAGDDHFQVRVWMNSCDTAFRDGYDGYRFNTSESASPPTLAVTYYAP